MKKTAIFALLIVFLIISFGLRDKSQIIEEKATKILKINEVTLNVEVASTDVERERGLSGKEGLKENEGMLFEFDREGNYGIWMRDMNFPIDIAWLDKNKKIIHIESDVLPETYPKVFNSSTPSLYVLETGANFFESNKIKIGDVAEF
ncbi:MAG: DUF192 domain-containing protein [Candidatus Zambryskibacteria bacterium]